MAASSDSTPKQLKVLMLHGYTQSGRIFHHKTRSLEKLLEKTFPPASPTAKNAQKPLDDYPGGIKLIYPTGPMNLRPSDIPGYTPSDNTDATEEQTDAWGWWRKSDDTGEYQGFEKTLDTIATAIKEANGIDAIVGFSQGAAAASLVASLLDPGRLEAWNSYLATHPDALPYPSCFLNAEGQVFHPPLKFAVSYSGFYATVPRYQPFYVPKIKTRMLHVIGGLDTLVEESRSLASAEACEGWGKGRENVVFHPGGHYVPVNKEMSAVLIKFIQDTIGDEAVEKQDEKEESVEDMDVPF